MKRWLIALILIHGVWGILWAATTFSPTGTVAKYRFTGYLEAMLVLYHAELDEGVKFAALQVLATAPEMDKYMVFISTD